MLIICIFNILISVTLANFSNDCVETLIEIDAVPLRTTDCCLTKLCSNTATFKHMIHNYPTRKEMYIQLCSEKFYLGRELMAGCGSDASLNSKINKDNDRNIRQIDKNQGIVGDPQASMVKKRNAIDLKPGIVNDYGWKSARISTSAPSKSHPTIQTTISERNSINDKKIRLENISETSTTQNSSLRFLDIPVGDMMHIDELQLYNEYLFFDIFSSLMGLLQSDRFPLDLLREVLDNKVPLHLIVLQLLETEYVAIGWITLWTILTICIPCILFAHFCCRRSTIRRLDEDTSDTSSDYQWRSMERTLALLLHLLLLILLIPIVLLLIGNQQISKQMSQSPIVTNVVFNDVKTFINNVHLQLTFATTSSTDITMETIRKDLDDVKNLLGRPYRDELASETGINIAFENLDDLKYATSQVTILVSDLLDECRQARAAGNSLQERLKEIGNELTMVKQHCLPKDRPLCYTLQHTGLDINFSCDNITTDKRIIQLERIGKENDFNFSIENALAIFEKLPEHISGEAARHVSEIKMVLNRKRTEVYKSAHSLDELARTLSDTITVTHGSVTEIVQTAARLDLWRWSVVLGISITVISVWCLLLCGAPCGCGITYRSTLFLTLGVVLSALVCLAVWSLGTGSLLVGGHGYSLLCRPLYDQPYYNVLGELFNDDGVLYGNGRKGGIFEDFIKGNDSITVQEVLNGCQRNHPAFSTFHLDNFFDIDSLTNYKSWDDFNTVITNFTIDNNNNNNNNNTTNSLAILSRSLQLNLQFLSTISSINLTKYRYELSQPVTQRDLNSFSEQLNTVARQLNDLTTSNRLNDLSGKVRRIIRDQFRIYNDFKDKILYKITTLDLLINPLSKRANQSLSHLKTIQYYLDNQGSMIAERNCRRFTSRIENYLDDLHQHVQKISKDIGRCKPLWDVFDAVRYCLCKLIIGPINGISFCCYFIILIFIIINIVALKIVQRAKGTKNDLLTAITHRHTRDSLIIDDEGAWASPSASTPPAMELRDVGNGDEQTLWSSPRLQQPSVSFIPPPPRLPTYTSRIATARVPQVSSVFRVQPPEGGRNESLRLVEPVCWKSGSHSPRSWI